VLLCCCCAFFFCRRRRSAKQEKAINKLKGSQLQIAEGIIIDTSDTKIGGIMNMGGSSLNNTGTSQQYMGGASIEQLELADVRIGMSTDDTGQSAQRI